MIKLERKKALIGLQNRQLLTTICEELKLFHER
jgi:hypothetical protein